MLETSDGEHSITLCHYPMMTFNHCMRAFMIHGHIHGNTNADYWPYLQSHERILNASVEVNNFEPVTFSELVENNRIFKASHPPALAEAQVPIHAESRNFQHSDGKENVA